MGNNFIKAFPADGTPPFLKWAGGKQWLASQAREFLPRFTGRYVEPFLGGGSLFFALQPGRAVLADLNRRLVGAYAALRDDPERVISALRDWKYSEACYYQVRAARLRSPSRRAAQFIYLNRTCWNGLYRENGQGQFNVPFGRFKTPRICDAEGLRRAAAALQGASLMVDDFEVTVRDCRAGDLVFLDPPYSSKEPHNGFIRYNDRLFRWEDQVRLAVTARKLAERGCSVLVTNAPHSSILELYPEFRVRVVRRRTPLAADPARRIHASEALISSFPLKWGADG